MTERCALAFDIGGTNLRAALIGLDGRVLAHRRAPSGVMPPDALCAAAARLAAELEREVGNRADGAGVGVAAMLPLPRRVVHNAPNLGWRNVPFADLMEAALSRPVRLANDVDAITLGEARFGAARGAEDVACVFVGTGVGCGLVVGGNLVTGSHGVAAELGHIKVAGPAGRRCGCGARGCLEAYTGGAALLARLGEAPPDDKAAITAIAGAHAAHLGHVDSAAANGDVFACALWDEVAEHLGRQLANLVTLLNPGVLVLGGGVWQRCPTLRAGVRAVFDAAVNAPAAENLRICDAALGDDAGLIGAGTLWLEGAVVDERAR